MVRKTVNKGSALSWLLLGLIGLMLILGRNIVKDVFYILLALGLILSAAAGVAGLWKARSKKPSEVARLLGSVVLFIVGVWILTHPSGFDRIVNALIGAVLILAGISWFLRARSAGRDVFVMCLGVAAILLGIVIVCSGAATSWPIILEGAGLIYAAAAGFITDRRFAA